jgi:ammonia channel protein AmtB
LSSSSVVVVVVVVVVTVVVVVVVSAPPGSKEQQTTSLSTLDAVEENTSALRHARRALAVSVASEDCIALDHKAALQR